MCVRVEYKLSQAPSVRTSRALIIVPRILSKEKERGGEEGRREDGKMGGTSTSSLFPTWVPSQTLLLPPSKQPPTQAKVQLC